MLVACQTLEAYKVEGAGGRGRPPTDRRSFGPGARTDRHASRPEGLQLPGSGSAARRRREAAFFSRRRTPLTTAGGVRRREKNAASQRRRAAPSLLGGAKPSGRLACLSVRAPGPNDRLSVWNQPRSQAPCTLYASSVWHATNKSPPLERTVPSQVHPAAQRRLSPTWLAPLRPRRPRPLLLLRGSVVSTSPAA